MQAIRAAHAFDGRTFLPGAATVLIDRDRIVGVESGRFDVPDDVEAGYPVADALAASTSQAATTCGVGRETGRLAEGYAADVLVVDGDLSEDPTLLSTSRMVLVRGTPVACRSA